MDEITFIQLKKNCKKHWDNTISSKLAVMGDCATQLLSTAIKGYGYEFGYELEVLDIDYDQIEAQTRDQHSELYQFLPKHVLIYLCSEKLYENYCQTALTDRRRFAEITYERISNYWKMINQQLKTNILQFTFIQQDSAVFGNFAYKTADSFEYQLQKLNMLMTEGCQLVKNVYLLDLNILQIEMGVNRFRDAKLYYIAHMPMAMEALPRAAKLVLDMINVLNGRLKKCVILDLDNTLWGGVIGDDGLEGIQLGDLGIGHAFTDLQRWLKELKNRGIILAVCSKNNLETAKAPFLNHPDMILRLDDISMFVANWHDKASNIRYIQETLNIGMDSIVFLDDNPFERDLVSSMIKEITVPALPEDPSLYLDYLKRLRLFETASYSEADHERTEQYRAEADRVILQQNFSTYDDYLRGLEMTSIVCPFDKFHYPRIAQLTQRSNQFNLRTIRYTEAEIEILAQRHDVFTLYFELKDRFGDYGLISVVVLDIVSAEELFISEWLMSCRVLKRGMEEFIINSIVTLAQTHGYSKISAEYIPTAKNLMVKDIYPEMGFTIIGENKYTMDVKDYQLHKTFITKE